MDSLKLLFIGNSFAEDTMEYAAEIAHTLGVSSVKLGVLYKGSCSIRLHYKNAVEDIPAYRYSVNEGDGWHFLPDYKISDAIKGEDWDWIAIQHGTGDGERYTSPECYENLSALVDYVKALAPARTKIAFNLTWTGEPTFPHHEILSYGGDTALMREKLVELTKAVLAKNPKIDLLVPTGTAVENARTSQIGILTRDGYHLSLDVGRYIAGLTFISCITGIDAKVATWAPATAGEYAVSVAAKAAQSAITSPFTITKIS